MLHSLAAWQQTLVAEPAFILLSNFRAHDLAQLLALWQSAKVFPAPNPPGANSSFVQKTLRLYPACRFRHPGPSWFAGKST